MQPRERYRILNSLEQREVALVRATMREGALLEPRLEAGLRTAISMARLGKVAGPGGEVDLEESVAPLCAEALKLLDVAGLRDRESVPSLDKLRPVAAILREQALRTRELLDRRFGHLLPAETLDAEIRQRALVLALGGGGGAGYIYLGAFKLLEECGLRPALVAGTSMGSIVALFRARSLRYDLGEMLPVMRSMSAARVFQLLSMESRYGLPAALRLYLHGALGTHFETEEGRRMTLADLKIPLITAVTGIRAGVLPRPLEYYESLLGNLAGAPSPLIFARRLPKLVAVVAELVQLSERLDTVHLGLDPGTEEFDVLDAIGFSSAVPGAIHYDVVRRDERMHAILGQLFASRELFRLADGGLVDNVPARAAWMAVQRGRIGTRNAFVLALDGFAPKLTTPVWLPAQTVIVNQVQRSCEWAHHYKSFRGPLSPTDVLPGVASLLKVAERGKAELEEDLPFIQRMMAPLPPLD